MHPDYELTPLAQWLADQGHKLEDFERIRLTVSYDKAFPNGNPYAYASSYLAMAKKSPDLFPAQIFPCITQAGFYLPNENITEIVLDVTEPYAMALATLSEAVFDHAPGMHRFTGRFTNELPPDECVLVNVATMSARWEADEIWLNALIDDESTPEGAQAMNDARWAKFKVSDAFAERPLDRDAYEQIRAFCLADERNQGTSFSEYYSWLARSEKQHIAPDGTVSETTRVSLTESHKNWPAQLPVDHLLRNLQVHPIHRDLVKEAWRALDADSGSRPARPRVR